MSETEQACNFDTEQERERILALHTLVTAVHDLGKNVGPTNEERWALVHEWEEAEDTRVPSEQRESLDRKAALLREFFFSRTDFICIRDEYTDRSGERRASPCPVSLPDDEGVLLDALRGHVNTHRSLTCVKTYKTTEYIFKKHSKFRVGTYVVNPEDNTCRFLCIDIDDKGKNTDLEDPHATTVAIVDAFAALDIRAYLERSGGGRGWHVWVFFEEPIQAKDARKLAMAAIPGSLRLKSGKPANALGNCGIEIFPKQAKVAKDGFGNMVWLPWWSRAHQESGFYTPEGIPYSPQSFERASIDVIYHAIDGIGELDGLGGEPVHCGDGGWGSHEYARREPSTIWERYREELLSKVVLFQVYGKLLTGKVKSGGWLECRDPMSESGDEHPSAQVWNGPSSKWQRGRFHSFIDGRSLSVFDFMVEQGMANDWKDARRIVGEWTGIRPPNESGMTSEEEDEFNRQLKQLIENLEGAPKQTEVVDRGEAWEADEGDFVPDPNPDPWDEQEAIPAEQPMGEQPQGEPERVETGDVADRAVVEVLGVVERQDVPGTLLVSKPEAIEQKKGVQVSRAELDDISSWWTASPPPQEWVFVDLIPVNIVAGLAAQGGLGKSYMLLQTAMSAAMGKPILPFLVPSKPHRVLALFGEDSPEEVWRRTRRITRKYNLPSSDTDQIKANLGLLCGKPFTLMKRMPIEATSRYDWLKDQVEVFKPELIIIDPKSQFFGLDENSNDETTQWYSMIRALTDIHPCSIIVSQHVGKVRQDDLDSGSVRGAVANRDDVRVLMTMTPLTKARASSKGNGKSDAEILGITDMSSYVKLGLTKVNYAKGSSEVIYLKKESDPDGTPEDSKKGGVLTQWTQDEVKERKEEVAEGKAEGCAKALAALIGDNPNDLSVRDIKMETSGNAIRTAMKETMGATKPQVGKALDMAIQRGWVVVERVNTGGTPREVPRKK